MDRAPAIARCLLITVALALLGLAAGECRAAEPRPNVLFILCDDLRWDALGCTGSPVVRTPHIDRLAAEGLLFRNAFCTTSLCSPSRASILSGLYAHAHGVLNNFTEFPAQLPSFPRRLHEAGYTTAYVGKWHMGEDNDEKRPGFDYFVTHKGQGKYFDTEFNLDGRERKVLPGYYTRVVTDLAAQWLRQQQPDRPWLLMLGHKAPHSFYIPEEKYAHTFDNVSVPYPATAFQLDDKPAWIKQRLATWHGIYGPLFDWRKNFPDDSPEAVKDFEAMTRAYWGTILSIDDSLGQLLGVLEGMQQLDNTVIVFMGDNGLLNGEHGMVDKRTMHEPSIRIPLLVRYPRAFARPRVIEAQVLTHDLAPTILELCGAPPLADIHGASLVRLGQEGSDRNWRRAWYYAYNYERQFPYTPNVRGVRTDHWKYIHYPHGDGGPDRHLAELYDLRNDPGETRNLIQDATLASEREELARQLRQLMQAAGALPDRMPLDAGIQSQLPDPKIR